MKKNIIPLLLFGAILHTGCTNAIPFFNQDNPSEMELQEVYNPDNCTYTYINNSGEVIFSNLGELMFENGIAISQKDEKYGLVNNKGEILAEPIYEFIQGPGEGGLYAFATTDLNGNVKVGYLDSNGKVVIEPRSHDIGTYCEEQYDLNFYNGRALYKSPENHKFGYIDKTGNVVIENKYSDANAFQKPLTPVALESNKYGYINTNGEVVVPFKFIEANEFSEGLAAVFNGKTWGYIDKKGNYAIPSQFGSFTNTYYWIPMAYDFRGGTTGVYLGAGQAEDYKEYKGQFAIIDKTGHILNNQKYDYLSDDWDKYEVKLNGKYMKLDRNGIEVKESEGDF